MGSVERVEVAALAVAPEASAAMEAVEAAAQPPGR